MKLTGRNVVQKLRRSKTPTMPEIPTSPVARAILTIRLQRPHLHYKTVAKEVRQALPEADTTYKSVATIVCRLRRAGWEIGGRASQPRKAA